MDSGWTPGGRQKQRSANAKDTLDNLLGDLLDDDSPPKKKTTSAVNTTGREQFSAKKQSSKDEDFYSSLAQAAVDDDLSDVSEADVNQMAKSIADLDDLDADLFPTGSSSKTPKRGSLKDKSGKPATPRRSGTPRSRTGTPRAASPPLRLTSPANRVLSPTHQRVTSPQGRGTPTGRETNGSPATGGIDANRPGSGSRTSPSRKPMSPPAEHVPEYKPSTAPGKLTDLGDRASVSLRPGQHEQERPRTVPKAKSFDFGDFDADDPLAGIPLSDEDEDLGLPRKKPARQQQKVADISPRAAPSPSVEIKQESPRQRNLFERPPTRSGSGKTESPEKEVEPAPVAKQQQTPARPALAKKKSEEALFSDDDDFLGGLGIEEKSAAPKPKAKSIDDDDEDHGPAKSVMDKLLSKDSVSKHLESAKERKEFVLDSKYTQPQAKEDTEDDFLFGTYKPSAAAGSNSSRPTSRRSVRFQDDDDIFGLKDAPAQTRTPPGKKADDGGMDWLEMATGGRSQQPDKPADKPAPKPAETKPSTAPSKAKSSAADWLGLTGADDDEEEFDYLKSSSFSAPARQGTAQLKTETRPKPAQQSPNAFTKSGPAAVTKEEQTPARQPQTSQPEPSGRDDYLGLGEEVDPNKLLRGKSESPKFGRGADSKDALKDDDIFATHSPTPGKSETTGQPDDEESKKPMFESAARRNQRMMSLSPRMTSPKLRESPRSPERTPRETSLLVQISQLPENTSSGLQKLDAGSGPQRQDTSSGPQRQDNSFGLQKQETSVPSTYQQQQQSQPEPEDELNSSTDFFSFKKKDSEPNRNQTGLQTNLQSDYQTNSLQNQTGSVSQSQQMLYSPGNQQFQTGQQLYPDLMTGSMQVNAQLQQQQQQQQQQQLQRQQQLKQQQLMKQLQRQQQQFQRQQQQQMQQLQQQTQLPLMPDTSMFLDDMNFGLGGNVDIDAQSKIRRLEVELQYARDILASTKNRYEEEIAAIENSFKGRMQLIEETQEKREQRWREENEQLMAQHVSRVRKMEEEKSEMISSMYRKLEEGEKEKSQEIDRLKEIHRQALENIKKDHEESLVRLKRSKDQQIDAAAASHDTSRSLVAAVEMIQTNAKDLGGLQRKIDNWHAQGLDDREITLRAKDEQLKMLQERLNKQQEDNDTERQKLQELIARLETQIREQTRMLEEERWKVKQEQSRLQGLQTALEDERRAWIDHQARERKNMEKSREGLLEEQRATLSQLHKERQTLAEEQVQFTMKQKMDREEGGQYSIRAAQAKAELEALTRAISESRDKYETLKDDIRKEEDRIQDERRRLEKERSKMESKEAELMEAANMIQDKSREIEETYAEGQRKYEEGMSALTESQRLESEEGKRIDTINHQLNILRVKEKEMTEERLRLSKEKREHEKFRNTLLCPNCRHPTRHTQNGNINTQQNLPQGLLVPSNGYPSNGMPEATTYPGQNGFHMGYTPVNPAFQLSVNTVDAVTESIKSDRSVRLWKMEAMKDQKYLEEQSLFLHTLKFMPYSSPKS